MLRGVYGGVMNKCLSQGLKRDGDGLMRRKKEKASKGENE